MRIEVDLYSGRPNPVCPLPPGEAAELIARLDALPEASRPAQAFDGLGFRGLKIHFDDPTGIVATVSDGVVTVDRVDGRRHHLDVDDGLARWLLDVAARTLPAAVIDVARQGLSARHGPGSDS